MLALVDRGCALQALGDPSGARDEFTRALERWQWLPAAEEGLGDARRALGEDPTATWEEAAHRYPQHRVTRRVALSEGADNET